MQKVNNLAQLISFKLIRFKEGLERKFDKWFLSFQLLFTVLKKIKMDSFSSFKASETFVQNVASVNYDTTFYQVPNKQYKGGRNGFHLGLPHLQPKLNKFILSKIENMSFLCYALNCKPEAFFVSSFLCRKRVPHHNILFHKMTQLVATFN